MKIFLAGILKVYIPSMANISTFLIQCLQQKKIQFAGYFFRVLEEKPAHLIFLLEGACRNFLTKFYTVENAAEQCPWAKECNSPEKKT